MISKSIHISNLKIYDFIEMTGCIYDVIACKDLLLIATHWPERLFQYSIREKKFIKEALTITNTRKLLKLNSELIVGLSEKSYLYLIDIKENKLSNVQINVNEYFGVLIKGKKNENEIA